MGEIKAIETKYNGYRFRSRLEARYAVMFDALGIKWDYEKEGYDLGEYGWYLPDFYLPEKKLWIEVKGQKPTDLEESKAFQLSEGTDTPILIVGDLGSVWNEYNRHEDDVFCISVPSASVDLGNLKTVDRDGWGFLMVCPICGFNYVNFGNRRHCKGNDQYEAWKGRGDALKIDMGCERGCKWVLVIGFHKGETFMTIENPTARVHDPLAAFLGDRMAIEKAINVAKSARFEHGETPEIKGVQ